MSKNNKDKDIQIRLWSYNKILKLHEKYNKKHFKNHKFYSKAKFLYLLDLSNKEFKAILNAEPSLIKKDEVKKKHKKTLYRGSAVKHFFKTFVPQKFDDAGYLMRYRCINGSFIPQN